MIVHFSVIKSIFIVIGLDQYSTGGTYINGIINKYECIDIKNKSSTTIVINDIVINDIRLSHL